ncbi:MAG TPA: tetratricopeptide repeat protein [Steroidobacteraceae bacterium]|nr:tetratricopeptide repeat protein [Steroidobacteraceae bacterium]HRX89523.1 tetratricopeptide repeat protein [Steroidobacteraceae bacterium]
MQLIVRSLILLSLGLLVAPTTSAVTDDDRVAAYRAFRTLFDAGNYQAALPVAENVVKLTEIQHGAEDRSLVNPLTNVGTTQLKLGNHAAAEASYLRAVQILERSATTTDRQFIAPLHGLGSTYLAVKRPDSAVAPLKRALDLTRNLDGLYNLEQLPILRQLIDAYVATGDFADAEKEHNYAYRVVTTAYGNDDPRLLEPLDQLAGWYEFVGRYATARSYHERALGIIDRDGKRNDPRKVQALRGIARSYRLEYLYGPEKAEEPATDAFGRPLLNFENVQAGQQQRRLEQALLLARQIVATNEPVDQRLLGETLVDLGDWYLISGSVAAAKEQYRKAWDALREAGDTALLNTPRQLAYRPSPFAVGRSRLDPTEATAQPVELRFTVTSEGRVRGVTAAPTDISDGIVRSVSTALGRSRYAPRIENGEAVDTDGVIFVEQVLVRNPSDSASETSP